MPSHADRGVRHDDVDSGDQSPQLPLLNIIDGSISIDLQYNKIVTRVLLNKDSYTGTAGASLTLLYRLFSKYELCRRHSPSRNHSILVCKYS